MAQLEETTPRTQTLSPPTRRNLRMPGIGSLRSLTGLLLALIGLAIWQVVASRSTDPIFIFFPAPTRIWATFVMMVQDGSLAANLWYTLKYMALGLLAGGIPALILGLTLGWSRPVRQIVDPVLSALHPVPKITLLPMVMIIVGFGSESRIIMIAISCFFPMVITTMSGVMQIDPVYPEVARNYGASRLRIFRRVLLPASLPFILAGLRLSLKTALSISIVMDIVVGNQGLGEIINFAWRTLKISHLYTGIFVIALLGVVMNLLIVFLQRKFVPWNQLSDTLD